MTTSRSFPLLHPLFPSPCPPHHPGLGPATPTIWEEGGHPPALSTPILNNLPPLQHGLGVGARAVVVSRSRQAGAVGGGGFPPGRCYFGSRGRAILVGLGDNGGKVPKDGVGVLEPELWLLRVGLGSSCCFWRSVWGVRQFSCLGYQGKGLESEMWDFFLLCFSGERPGRVFPFQLAPWRCRGGSRGGTACLVNGAGALLQETSGAERRGQGCVPPQKKPWRVSRCPGSPACERGCVTDPLSAGYGERGFKCPICSKSVASDEMEMHFIMCLSKPRLSYNDDVLTKDAGECVICLEELLQGDTIARLPCLCIYHKSCIDSWFEVNRSCPEHPSD
uniref:E3 ubiquitin-protein ligase ZNRF1 n=1 Tax=Anas platyrhynchos platyrhynchos TaxID=8840 RepID=A0A493SZL2_ANAPP